MTNHKPYEHHIHPADLADPEQRASLARVLAAAVLHLGQAGVALSAQRRDEALSELGAAWFFLTSLTDRLAPRAPDPLERAQVRKMRTVRRNWERSGAVWEAWMEI